MRNLIALLLFFLVTLFVTGLLGCSRGRSDATMPQVIQTVSESPKTGESDHNLWGIWEINFDFANLTASITPQRNLPTHFNITNMITPPACDDCFHLLVNSFNPTTRVLDVDVTLRNPTEFFARDVRGILYTNDYGHELRNSDEWTSLWDVPGGEPVNPFKAFAKQENGRVFAAGVEQTENYLIYIPLPPNYQTITFAVDVSWPTNCKEPFQISSFWQEDIGTEMGSSGSITVDVLDWQNDVSTVIIEAPSITGEASTALTNLGDNTWGVDLINATGAGPGSYIARLKADSTNPPAASIYDFVEINITGPLDYPIDVTPPWLNFPPNSISVDNGFAFLASKDFGLHIFDLADPSHPVWVNKVDTPYDAERVTASGGYAYVSGFEFLIGSNLMIIDVDPVESAHLVKIVEAPYQEITDVAVKGEYAYVTNYGNLQIIDISPPEEAYIYNTLSLGEVCSSIDIEGDLAFLDEWGVLVIVDISQPGSAEIVNTVQYPTTCDGLDASGGYVYTASGFGYMEIIDVDPPEAAHLVKTLELQAGLKDVAVEGGYAYVTSYNDYVQVIDIDPIDSASIVKSIETNGDLNEIQFRNGYGYVSDEDGGLITVDLDPIPSGFITKINHSAAPAQMLKIVDGIAYSTRGRYGLDIIDIASPETASILNTVHPTTDALGLDISNGYAFVADHYDGILIFDITPPESAYLYKTLDTYWGYDNDIAIQGDYAYSAEDPIGMRIWDINPPSATHEVNIVPTDDISSVVIYGEYAYCADPWTGLAIIDITPPEDAYIIKYVETLEAIDVAVIDNYAYVADADMGVVIIDISQPDQAEVVKIVDTGAETRCIAASPGLVCAGGSQSKISIVDVDPPADAHIIDEAPLIMRAMDIAIDGNYVYVADNWGGIRILKLW